MTTAVLALLVVLVPAMVAPSAQAQTFTTLHSFDNTDGAYLQSGLVQATDGKFYGTTVGGGANGDGTVFKITPSGTLTTLYSFCSQGGSNCTDGAYANAGLIQATDGNFYGTTSQGGGNGCGAGGCGTVFSITPSGTLTTLHTFDGTDGNSPIAVLVQATNGKLYGTTYGGGANNNGTVFSITPSGTLTTLHTFDGTDGSGPNGVVQATNGNFYGTTQGGGANFVGTVFKITPSGTLTTLHSFDGTDGSLPFAGLVQATNGKLYGTTYSGGTNGVGTVFKITPSGTLTTLYSFCPGGGGCTDGNGPDAGLVQATNGNFYGTTQFGGANNGGTVFKITPSGTLTTLYNFCSQGGSNCTDGAYPEAVLVQATCGKLYGTTEQGGSSSACTANFSTGCGTVFSLSVGLGPFVETNPASGKVGAAVKILGTNLTGATSVTFNGTAATFTVKSKSEITTTVPTGATTGTVHVITPRRTLSSNVPFTVK
jgi:uncharacterized repeat protein (TIGR03803 family)